MNLSNRIAILVAVVAVLNICAVITLATIFRLPAQTTSLLFWVVGIAWAAIGAVVLRSRGYLSGVQIKWLPQMSYPLQPTTEALTESFGPMQYTHAEHASIISDVSDVKLLDIGFVAFWGKSTKANYRTKPIPGSLDILQPYIQIENQSSTERHITFEILDQNNRVVFRREAANTFGYGVHLITPPARLRFGQNQPSGMWALRVRVDGEVLALHHFGWREDEPVSVDGHINADGEVDERVIAKLVDDFTQPMSLDDLLAGDDNDKSEGSLV